MTNEDRTVADANFQKFIAHMSEEAKKQEELLYRNNFNLYFIALQRQKFLEDNPELSDEERAYFIDNDPVMDLLKRWEPYQDILQRFKSENHELWQRILNLLNRMYPIVKENLKVGTGVLPEGELTEENYRELRGLMEEADKVLIQLGVNTKNFDK